MIVTSTRNLTVAVPADLLRRARVLAATRGTSVSRLVTQFLEQLTSDSDDYDEHWEAERALMAEGLPMRVGEVTWARGDVHDRG